MSYIILVVEDIFEFETRGSKVLGVAILKCIPISINQRKCVFSQSVPKYVGINLLYYEGGFFCNISLALMHSASIYQTQRKNYDKIKKTLSI